MKRESKRLKSIKIQGFKSIPFQHPLELMFGDINILLGANGAGKSNIISFFKMLGFMMSGSLQRFIPAPIRNSYITGQKRPRQCVLH